MLSVADLLRKNAAATQRQNAMNRRVLEEIQNKLLCLNEDILEERSACGQPSSAADMLILFPFDAESDDEGKIFQWLQYPDCSAKINSLLYDRAKGTGSWFFDSNEFSALKTGKKRVLWLEGSGTPSGSDRNELRKLIYDAAGCGKSTIMCVCVE